MSEKTETHLRVEAATAMDQHLERWLRARGDPHDRETRQAFWRTVHGVLDKTAVELNDEINASYEQRFTVREVRASDYVVTHERADELVSWLRDGRAVMVRGKRGVLVNIGTQALTAQRDKSEVTSLLCVLDGNVGPLACTPAEVTLATVYEPDPNEPEQA
jgi:hypothetical protein